MDKHFAVHFVFFQFCGKVPSFSASVLALGLSVISMWCSILLVIEVIIKTQGKFLTNQNYICGRWMCNVRNKKCFLFFSFKVFCGLLDSCFYLFNFFFLNTNYVWGLILICVGDTGTEGAIAGLQENSQLSKGDTWISSYSTAHQVLSQTVQHESIGTPNLHRGEGCRDGSDPGTLNTLKISGN